MCAIFCELTVDDRPLHLTALVSAALRALQPTQSSAQRSAVAVLSFMRRQCNDEEREAMRAAGFVDAAIYWMPSFRLNPMRVRVLQAACELAQPQQLPPIMAALLPDLMAADEKRLEAVARFLFDTCRSLNLPLEELFGSGDVAAGVAARLIQLMGHPSHRILKAALFVCCQLTQHRTDEKLLLDAGLLQPAHFAPAMGSSDAVIRANACWLLNRFARKDGTARAIVKEGLLSTILTACADTDAKVMAEGISGLLCCVEAVAHGDVDDLRPIVLQACTAATFPSATVTHLMSTDQNLTDSLPHLIRAWSAVLQWPESAVDSARLHPLAQRLVDVGLLPHIEGQSHKRAGVECSQSAHKAG